MPNDEFFYENLQFLKNADGYAVDRKEIQRLLFDSVKDNLAKCIKVAIEETHDC